MTRRRVEREINEPLSTQYARKEACALKRLKSVSISRTARQKRRVFRQSDNSLQFRFKIFLNDYKIMSTQRHYFFLYANI